jgi:GT2 family glycosyltransferase
MNPVASLVIPTSNRARELRDLLRSAYAQTVPLEVLVMDDGDSEASGEMIRREFPQVRHHRLGFGKGPAFQRNRGVELASCDIVFSLDDDSVLVSSTVEQTLAEFDDTRIGAIGIPLVNVLQDRTIRQRAPDASCSWVAHAFIGAAHAVRRDAFLQVGGYREHFFFMGEEGDLCLRMMQAGYVTRLGRADPIYHLESPRRNHSWAGFSGRRNDILFAWHNVPWPFFPFHLLCTTLNGLRAARHSGCFRPMLRGMVRGYADCFRRWNERRPVSAEVYRIQRLLKKRGPQALTAIENRLPTFHKSLICPSSS